MFDAAFAALFRAVERISRQLQDADLELRGYLAVELSELQHLGDQYMDHWLVLDEQIQELMDTFELQPHMEEAWQTPTFTQTAMAQPTFDSSPLPGPTPAPPALEAGEEAWAQLAFATLHQQSAAFRRGMGYFDLLLFNKAEKELAQVVDSASSVFHPVAHIYLAAALAGQDKAEQALPLLQTVRAQTSDELLHCAADEVEALICFTQHRYEDAARCLMNSTDRVSDYGDVWYNLGVCCLHLNELERAEDAFMKARAAEPDDWEAAALLGWVQVRRNDWQGAAATCRQGRAQRPEHPGFWMLQARLLTAAGDHSDAVAMCRKIVQLYPQWRDAWSTWVWNLLALGKAAEAVGVLKKQLAVNPNDPIALFQLGVVHLLDGRPEEAERQMLAALPGVPDKSLVWIALGRASCRRQAYAQAQKRFARALRDDRKAVKRLALYYQGLAYLERAQYQEAQKYLHAASLCGDANAAILLAMARAAHALGRHDEAQRLFGRAEQTISLALQNKSAASSHSR